MYTPTFNDLAGDEANFFERFFNQRPLLRKNALPVEPAEVLGLADLDDLLAQEAIRLPYIRVARGGTSVREATYARTHVVQNETVTDAVDAEQLRELFRSGATITWNSLNHVRANLRDLSAMLNEKFATRSDVIAFLTPAGRQGYAPHHDPVDVFVIQLAGTKEWRLWKAAPDRRDDTGHYDLDELGEPSQTIVLEPGDVLYLPYGTPHVAAAQDTVSLHLSVVVQPRPWRDLLGRVVREILETDPAFAEFPLLTRNHSARQFTELVGLLATRLSGLDAAAELRQLREIGWAEEGGSRYVPTFTAVAAIDDLNAATPVRLDASSEFTFGESTDGRTVVTVGTASAKVRTRKTAAGAATIRVPDAVADRLRTLEPDESVAAGDLYAGVSPGRSVSAAKSLARLGILVIG